jgi:succinoglycan biosynthesis transport protein ExoP
VSAFEERGTRPTRYVEALRQHWLLVVITVIVSVASAFTFSKLVSKRYEARADILVTPISSTDDSLVGFNILRESTDPSRSILTAARLIKTPQVADAVRARLHLTMGRRALLDAVAVNPVGQANILSIVAAAPHASEAARIANAFADEFIRQRTKQFQAQLAQRVSQLKGRLRAAAGNPANAQENVAIQGQLGTLVSLAGESDPTLHVATRAVPPYAPASPRPMLIIVVALFASLLLGVGGALAREMFNPRVTREDELIFEHRLPVLARVPQMPQKQVHDHLAQRGQLPGEAWDAYRMLRANLATAGPSGDFPRTVLMTSAIRGEGKTMSTVNLAITLAMAGAKVIAVDGDLRHPMLATVFGVALRGNGFADIFMSEASLEHALVPAPGYDNLRLVLGSPEDTHLVDLLEPNRILRGFERLMQEADVILVDSPPLTEVADALSLADAVEAVVIVTRLGYTRREELSELRRMLAHRGISPTGLIVTTRRRRAGSYYVTRSAEILDSVSEPVTARALKADAERG